MLMHDPLEKRQVGVTNVVEGDLWVYPGEVLLCTLPLVVDHRHLQPLPVVVKAFVKLSTKELDAHDGKDEPEDETDQQDVDDWGDGVHQCVDHNLYKIWSIKPKETLFAQISDLHSLPAGDGAEGT